MPDVGARPLAATAADTCRNCGASAPGAYCPSCGQETQLALPAARQFIKDAAGRYVALDGRLWRTLGALLFRPGFLTREYFAGRRRRYVRPARLFLVLSIAMFALLRLLIDVPVIESGATAATGDDDSSGATIAIGGTAPRITIDGRSDIVLSAPKRFLPETLQRRVERFNALPAPEKMEQVAYGMLRYGPYAMIVLLPVFALLVKLLYIGRERAYPERPRRYAEHLVFAAHDLAFLFAMLIVYTIVPWPPLRAAILVWIAAYGILAMKAVYGGRWSGVVARASVLAVSYALLAALTTVGLLVSAVVWR